MCRGSVVLSQPLDRWAPTGQPKSLGLDRAHATNTASSLVPDCLRFRFQVEIVHELSRWTGKRRKTIRVVQSALIPKDSSVAKGVSYVATHPWHDSPGRTFSLGVIVRPGPTLS